MHTILADTDALRRAAFHLRYEQYMQLGTIQANAEEEFRDALDDREHARILLALDEDRLVGTMRILISAGPQTPLCADELFAAELSAMGRSPAAPIYEVTRLAIAQPYRNNPEPLYRLFAHLAWLALDDRPAYAVSPARLRQAVSYKKILGMHDLAPARYSPKQEVDLHFVGARYEHVFAHAIRRYRGLFPEQPYRALETAH